MIWALSYANPIQASSQVNSVRTIYSKSLREENHHYHQSVLHEWLRFLSSTSHRWKILGVVILIVVIVVGGGSYVFPNLLNPQRIVSLTSTTGSISISQTSRIITPATTVQPQWIRIGQVKPVNYYLSLLEANGTTPYVQVASGLRKLPDFTNATAVAQVAYLALNATNPETREAFELMIKGGTANPSDFSYSIPEYNTELQILYWLAEKRQLKQNDTLALAISLSNGIWITIGDDVVQSRVRRDVVDLLDFFRETNGLQQILGYTWLEQLPLEAKIALAWLGGDTGTHGPHAITGTQTKRDTLRQKMDSAGYWWDNVNTTTLRQMRNHVKEKGWVTSSIDQTVANLEDYFYFSGKGKNFNYVSARDVTIQVNGETVSVRNMNNANFNFQYYLKNGKAIGVCEDEMTLVSAFLKSWGIATLPMSSYWPEENWYNGHTYTMYYDVTSKTWRVFPYQIGISFYVLRDAYIFIPPVLQNQFVPAGQIIPREAAVSFPFQSREVNTKMFAPMYNITGTYLNMYASGVYTAQMKQWVLYKVRPFADTTTFGTWRYQGQWNVIQGSQKLVSKGRVVEDLGQPYVYAANMSYSYSNGSLFFRFDLRGKIPSHPTAHVSSVWYQVLLDVDSDSDTGYHWSSNFTPDYMLAFAVTYDASTNLASISSVLSKHCGGSRDWCWANIGFTQHFSKTPLILGGVGEDFFVLTCDYQDIMVSHGSTIRLLDQIGIMYDGQVYNDYVPGEGTISVTL